MSPLPDDYQEYKPFALNVLGLKMTEPDASKWPDRFRFKVSYHDIKCSSTAFEQFNYFIGAFMKSQGFHVSAHDDHEFYQGEFRLNRKSTLVPDGTPDYVMQLVGALNVSPSNPDAILSPVQSPPKEIGVVKLDFTRKFVRRKS